MIVDEIKTADEAERATYKVENACLDARRATYRVRLREFHVNAPRELG